nr:MAG TPA: hypothetical protein [Caudoviricetes sp.]
MRNYRDPRPHPTRLPGLLKSGGDRRIQLWENF